MKKIVKEPCGTIVSLEGDEMRDICKVGQGSECCAFLVVDPEGFKCIRMYTPFADQIMARLSAGTMKAKGRGGWEGCAWPEK